MSASKRKGTAWESAVVAYLNANGYPDAERRALAGVLDRGDVAGIPGVVLECKAEKAIDLAGYMGELIDEMANANATVGAAVVKRRGKNVADAYAVMPLSLFVWMLHLIEDNPERQAA